MDKKLIIPAIRDYLVQQEDVLFAYVYDSFVKGNRYRDIDLAVYSELPKLMKLGTMRTDLVKLTKKEIDLTFLNDLPTNHPAFGHEIVTKGKLFYNNAPDKHDEYKKRIHLNYFDTSRLREIMNKAFLNRLRSDNFGNRDYA